MKREKTPPVMMLWAEGRKPAEIAERLKMKEDDVTLEISGFISDDPMYGHEFARGFREGQFLMLRRLVRNGLLTAEAAADDMGITVEEFFDVTDRLEAQRY